MVDGILLRIRTGVPWRDLPPRYGSWKTVCERHRRWSAEGTWDRILRAVQADADLARRVDWSMVGVDWASRGAQQHAADPGPARTTSVGDKAYGSRRNRRSLRRRPIRHTIPESQDQRADRRRRGSDMGRPADRDRHRRGTKAERTINRLKNSRAVATRYDRRAYVFHRTDTAAAVRLWLRH